MRPFAAAAALLVLLTAACASSSVPVRPAEAEASPPPAPVALAAPPPPEPVMAPRPRLASAAPPAAVFQPAWELLPAGTPEPQGYGLYSYVLIREKPQTADEIDTALHVIERLLHTTDAVAVALAQNDRSELNVFFFPSTGARAAGRTPNELAKWILANYDHVRAKRILNRLGETRSGPYLVTSARPLGGARTNAQVLVQVLTRPKRTYLRDWVDFFVQKASAPAAWDEVSLRQVLFETRDHLEAIGAILPGVAEEAKRVFKWVKDAAGG